MVTATRKSKRSPEHLQACGKESALTARAAGDTVSLVDGVAGRERAQSGKAEGKEGLGGD